jgi:hypothetical protein
MMFMCDAFNATYPVAMIEAYEACKPESRSVADMGLGFLRLRLTRKAEFISVKSIIRGLVLIEGDSKSSCIVLDYLDLDLFLRLREAFPGFNEI